jgi:Na+/alanine symporter
VIVISLILFCLSTVLGWYTYGESAFVFLFGAHKVKIYRILHMLVSASGALISVQLLWDAADVCNGLMAIPNLFSLILFGGVVVRDTRDFLAEYDRGRA